MNVVSNIKEQQVDEKSACCFFGDIPLRMFTSEAEVAAAGMDKFRIAAPFYFMMALFGIFSGVIRGCGQTFVLMPVAVRLLDTGSSRHGLI